MKQSIWNAVIPFHRNDLQKRVYVCPSRNCQQNIIAVFTAIENVHIIKIKIHNMNLWVVPPKIIPELIYIMAPFPVYQK